jgi:hypothetical protein
VTSPGPFEPARPRSRNRAAQNRRGCTRGPEACERIRTSSVEMGFREAVIPETAEAFQGIERPAPDIVRFNAETITQRLSARSAFSTVS